MKYKVGDKVRIKDDLQEGKYDVSPFMLGYCGEVMTIEDLYDDAPLYYYLVEDDRKFIWHEDTLEPVVPTFAEIKENNLYCVIKVDSKEEAVELLKVFNPNGYDANYVWDYLMCGYQKHDGTICFNVSGNGINGFDTETYYKRHKVAYGEIYRFKDLIAKEGVSHENSINKPKACLRAFPNNGISAKNGGKNPMKFTFYTEEGYRIDKSNNTRIPTMTTEVLINGKDYQYSGSATCDKTDYEEREGVLNAIANAVCGGNFDREFNKVMKNKAFATKKSRTCTYCGQLFDTVEEKQAHEDWHVECKKARRERYLLRKRAKEIAFEEQAQKMAKEMMK